MNANLQCRTSVNRFLVSRFRSNLKSLYVHYNSGRNSNYCQKVAKNANRYRIILFPMAIMGMVYAIRIRHLPSQTNFGPNGNDYFPDMMRGYELEAKRGKEKLVGVVMMASRKCGTALHQKRSRIILRKG